MGWVDPSSSSTSRPPFSMVEGIGFGSRVSLMTRKNRRDPVSELTESKIWLASFSRAQRGVGEAEMREIYAG